MHTIQQTGHNGTMMKEAQIKIACRVVFICLSVTICCLNKSAFGLFRWPRTCLTMPNWTGWDTWLWCRLPTCSWRISGCSVVRTSNGPSMLWRDTMQSHERYPWSCRPLCLLRMLLQVSHFFFTSLLSVTNVSLNSQALCEALKKWQNSGDLSGKRRRCRSSSERCYIDFHFEQGNQTINTILCVLNPHAVI